MRGFQRFCLSVAIAALATTAYGAGRQQVTSVTVFAASDLAPALKVLAPLFERQSGTRVVLVFGSTGTLSQQIRNGAPADVFFAANESFVADLEAAGLTRRGTRMLYARGRIALAVPASRGPAPDTLRALADASIRRVSIANPQHAPYGAAAKQALENAGVWEAVSPKLVYGENIQQAAQFIRTGAVEAGIIARSVADVPELRWHLLDESLHAPLNQAAAVLARSPHPDNSQSFLEFVIGVTGRSVLKQFGFQPPTEAF